MRIVIITDKEAIPVISKIDFVTYDWNYFTLRLDMITRWQYTKEKSYTVFEGELEDVQEEYLKETRPVSIHIANTEETIFRIHVYGLKDIYIFRENQIKEAILDSSIVFA